MMMKIIGLSPGKVITACTLCMLTTYAPAQKLSKEEYIALAKDLKAKLEKRGDQEVALVNNTSVYTFDYFKPDPEFKAYASEVSAKESTEKEYLSLRKGAGVTDRVFFDAQSKIKSDKQYNYKGTIIPMYAYDRKYNSGDIFHNDVEYRDFPVSMEEAGEYRRLEYTKLFFDVKYLVSAYFHEAHYQQTRTLVFEIPNWLEVDIKEYNFEGYNIQKTETDDPRKKLKRITYTATGLLPLNRDDHSPAFAKNYPHVLFLAKKYTKDNKSHNIFASTADLYNWYHKLVKEVSNNTETLKPMVGQLTAGKKTDMEKMEAVFYWVQDNIRYIAFENGIMGFKPEAADKVFTNRYGDCKGMAHLLKEMLAIAGFDARLTWIGTNDIPYDYSTPSLGVDNHMICTVILNGQKYFLDGTENFIATNDYAHRIQGRQVLIEDGDKYILDHVPGFGKERNKVQENISMTLDGGKITGKSNIVYNGEFKTLIQHGYSLIKQDKQQEGLKKMLTGENSNVVTRNVVTSDMYDRKMPLTASFDFDLNNAATTTGNELYVSIDYERMFGNYEIDTLRTDDFEFESKRYYVGTTTLIIPDGYKVDYMPEKFEFSHPDFHFNFTYSQTGNTIVYNREVAIDNALIRKKDLPTWNAQVKKLKKFYNDQIVLIKP